ncbi:nucleotide sugar dehydrogenase [Marinoscillum pacificum]|uniref:nucleotide sugar dehydrogenase n=1 Tax=Marinoscillum pacificum TaxID=392723 RepID=UPI00215881AF|nr:nucleotide sugar dehydrogenase [Marinoscillum pacificum]
MEFRVAIIGLGYVGLPLAVESGKKYQTIGFDINLKRISELQNGKDRTLEVSEKELSEVKKLSYSTDSNDLLNCNFYIVTVPTPIDEHKNPDLTPILKASELLSTVLKKGDIVVYESTVYPGCTEEVCVPILEKSGLKYNEDFFCGYSPERINPGDKVHRLPSILKVTSGSTPEIANVVDDFYSSLVTAGTFKASSIKVAEAAKVIENSQRDINIAFVNELSLIFNKLGIDTNEVLEAAGTKWNFLKFSPGLVGGHCIGVDPYYLTYKAESVGYHPQVILAGRRINDNMGAYVAKELIKLLNKKAVLNQQTKVLILGITFKENCPDIRNSRVIDIYTELIDFGLSVDVMDTEADPQEVLEEYGIELTNNPNFADYRGVVLAVAHKKFMDIDWFQTRKKVEVIFDVKGLLPKDLSDSRL